MNGKNNGGQSYNEVLLSNKQEQVDPHNHMDAY